MRIVIVVGALLMAGCHHCVKFHTQTVTQKARTYDVQVCDAWD